MEVILKEEVKGLGKAGELVKVRGGYGRNYLLPQNMAVIADKKNIKLLEHHKRTAEAAEKKRLKVFEALADRLKTVSITIARESGEGDKLFGSVTSRDISDALRTEGINIDKKCLVLKEPIKQIGAFDIDVKLHPQINCVVKVWVVKK